MSADNTIQQNLHKWEGHHWAEDGDEWKGQALCCGTTYERWKQSLVDHLLLPYVVEAKVLEIGPGHGRWSSAILTACARLSLVDLSPACIDFCRRRFEAHPNVDYFVTDGKHLPANLTRSIDFVWSYDAFVHMSAPVIAAYLGEIERVLVAGGRAIIHHAGRRHGTLWLGWLCRLGDAGRRVYRHISMGGDEGPDGWRSNVSAQLVAELAGAAGLVVEKQLSEWEPGIGVPRFRDVISVLRRKA